MRARLAGAAILVVMALAYMATREHAPIVNVRWRAGVAAEARAELLRRFDLRRCEPSGDRTDTCELLDVGQGNIRALVTHDAVEDTYHIDRAAFRVAADADRAKHVTWIAHRTPLARVPWLIEALVALAVALVAGASAVRAFAHDNVRLAWIALAVFALLQWATGQIDVQGGLGYDGKVYAGMLEEGLTAGTRFTVMRPLVVLLAKIPYYFTQDVIASFEILNYVFVFVQAYLVARLAELYGASRSLRAYLVVSLSLCIATATMFAYYPVLIDAGGYVMVTLALYAVLVAPRPVAYAATLAAVAAREFAIGVAFFGWCRAIRKREGPAAMLGYVPAIVLFGWLRQFAEQNAKDTAERAYTIPQILVMNLAHWQQSWYLVSLVYFLLTTFGGISMVLWARPRDAARVVIDEPEWGIFGATVLAITLIYGVDVWRYLAFMAPFVVVSFARASARWSPREQTWLLSVGAVGTLFTQLPFRHMTLEAYFRDWFPYYIAYTGTTPFEPEILWPVWGPRLAISAALVALLVVSHAWRPQARRETPEVAPPMPI